MTQKIDPTKQVKLTKLLVVRGNFYHPRIYNPGDLPDEIMAQAEHLDQSFLKPPSAKEVLTPTIAKSDDVIENKIAFSVEVPNTTPAPYPTETVVLTASKIDVNRATVDELAKLSGVGVTTASKLVKERETQPFSSVEDLDSRVPLRTKTWEELKPQILIQ